MEAAAEEDSRPRAVFMAFGTKGDVFPIAAIAAAFAFDQQQYNVVFITHLAHQNLSVHLATRDVIFIPVSTPPVLSLHHAGNISDSERVSFFMRKKSIQTEHRQECLSVAERLFGVHPSTEGDFILINFFALEGWHLAELFQVKCIIASPYVVPYSAPSSFERRFKQEHPLLYRYFQDAPVNMVGWKDVTHWMWTLFTEDWGSWRSNSLNLSPFSFMDPVTNLPMWHMRAQSPLLLYGFSKEIVEHPGYWPSNVRICGFWFLPMEWQFSCSKCRDAMFPACENSITRKNELCPDHADLQHFLLENSQQSPIFIGLSSIGSMGFLRNPCAFLKVLEAVLEMTNYNFILFSAGFEPLDALVQSIAGASPNLSDPQPTSEDSTLLFNKRIYCFSGSIPYSWLFSRCAAAIHHGGSGSTAAALYAGIPQIVCPCFLDQFYWAERLYWLGVSPEPLQNRLLFPDTDDSTSISEAANALGRAIKFSLSPKIKAQASQIAERIASEDGLGEALKALKEKVLWPS